MMKRIIFSIGLAVLLAGCAENRWSGAAATRRTTLDAPSRESCRFGSEAAEVHLVNTEALREHCAALQFNWDAEADAMSAAAVARGNSPSTELATAQRTPPGAILPSPDWTPRPALEPPNALEAVGERTSSPAVNSAPEAEAKSEQASYAFHPFARQMQMLEASLEP